MCSSDRSLKSKVLPGPISIFSEFCPDGLVRAVSGTNCRAASRLEKVVLDSRCSGGNEIDPRRGGRGGLLQEGGQRLRLVTGLNLLDVRHVAGVESLRADESERERRRRLKDLRRFTSTSRSRPEAASLNLGESFYASSLDHEALVLRPAPAGATPTLKPLKEYVSEHLVVREIVEFFAVPDAFETLHFPFGQLNRKFRKGSTRLSQGKFAI